MNELAGVAKQAVARNFGQAASSYYQVNSLQNVVAKNLLERMELMKLTPATMLDMGSGPGTSSSMLEKSFRKTRIIEADISVGMLAESRRRSRKFFSRRSWLCTDAEMPAIRSSSIDIVFSSLMLQWCNEPDLVFREIDRLLKPDGLFIFSSFGPDTLKELRNSWRAVDEESHVNTFLDMHDVGDALLRSGLENPVLETEYITFKYDDASTLMRDLKQLGAQNSNQGRRKSLTGKTRMQAMLAEYEKCRVEGKLPASYEVVYGHAWKPGQVLSRSTGPGVASYSLDALRDSAKAPKR